MTQPSESGAPEPGTDSTSGTDPKAKYREPGYQEKSLGQAVSEDDELVDDLVRETHGDLDEAERIFNEKSSGAPKLADQADKDDS